MKKIIIAVLCLLMLTALASCGGKPGGGTVSQADAPQFPMKLDGGRVTVEELMSVDGVFVEKGNADEVKNVSAARITNNSDEMLEYGVISFQVNGIERAEYIISALPAGESAVVMESFARGWMDSDEYSVEKDKCMFSYCSASDKSDEADVSVSGSEISVTNKTDHPLNVTIVYKYIEKDSFYGGIAFRGRFENISPGETVKRTSDRFGENTKIVNIITENTVQTEVTE